MIEKPHTVENLMQFAIDVIQRSGEKALSYYGKGQSRMKFDEELVTKAEDCRITALDETNPIYVNDNAVENALLIHGDLVHLGKHTLAFASDGVSLVPETEPAEDPPAHTCDEQDQTAPATAYVQILSGEHIGRIIPLTGNMIRLGKTGRDCAIIVHRDNGYYLSHLEGAAPTINGVSIGEESVMLSTGSTIQIADTELQFFC